jgi:trafficking protein particle complex subunit 11
MLSDYRQEKWFTIFTDILLKTIQSAVLGASINDFVATSIEALSPSIKIEKVERQNILENLWKVFNVRKIVKFRKFP